METCSADAIPSTGFVNGWNPSFFCDGPTATQEPSREFAHYRLPDDEAPNFGDEPGAGKRLRKIGRQDWRAWQLQKEVLARGYEAIGEPERALSLRNCCHRLVVHRYENATVVVGRAECRDLLCPSGMRARSRALQKRAVTAIENFCGTKPGVQGLFITFTIKNCLPHELKETIGRLIRAFSKLMLRARVKRAVRAWLRSIEVSRNADTGEFHAHIHAVWFVDRATYFRRNSTDFIAQPELRALWRKTMCLDYDPVVDIRPLRGVLSPLDERGRKSLREVIKYALKPGTLIENRGGRPVLLGAESLELFDAGDGEGLRLMKHVPMRAVFEALRTRRLFAMSRNLVAAEIEDIDFNDDPESGNGPREAWGALICIEHYVWKVRGRVGDYFLVRREFEAARQAGSRYGP